MKSNRSKLSRLMSNKSVRGVLLAAGTRANLNSQRTHTLLLSNERQLNAKWKQAQAILTRKLQQMLFGWR